MFRFSSLEGAYVGLRYFSEGKLKLGCSVDRVALINDVDIMFRNSPLAPQPNKFMPNCQRLKDISLLFGVRLVRAEFD